MSKLRNIRQEHWDDLWGAYINALKALVPYKDYDKLDPVWLCALHESIIALKTHFPNEVKGMFPE